MTDAVRRAPSVVIVALLAGLAVTATGLGIVVTSGLGFADAAGQPLGIPAVSITPSPVPGAEPSATATPAPSPMPLPLALPTPSPFPSTTPPPTPSTMSGDDEPEVVTAPPPVAVELEDHGGLSDDDSPIDDSGSND